MSYEPVKLGMQASTPSDPNAIPLPLAADSSYWSLSPEQQRRMLQDLETYRQELPQLLQQGQTGRFAIVKDGRVAGVWDTSGDALQAAKEAFGDVAVSIYLINPKDLARFEQLERR